MPTPQVKTAEEEAQDELDQLQQAEQRAADSIEEFGKQASAAPEVNEELAQPVKSGHDSFFSGTEGVDDAVDDSRPGDRDGEGQSPSPGGDPGPAPGDEFAQAAPDAQEHSFEEAINQGSARLAVVGLDEADGKEDLRQEFEEVFEAFQLGHYGNRVMHDYLLHGAEDVNPVWGLAGSAMLCSVMVVYMRPDGDEAVSKVKDRLQRLREGGEP